MHSLDTNAGNSAGSASPSLLADRITAILAKHGHPRPADWLAGLRAVHVDAVTPSTPEDIQRFLINRYWHLQLGTLPFNTMDQRYCLVPNGTIDRWLQLFDEMVAPLVVQHNLPPAIH